MAEIGSARRLFATSAGFAVMLVLAPLALASPASAQRQTSPWCAQFSDGNGSDCSYPTFEACQATISGVGGTCNPNPFSPSNPPRRGLLDRIFNPAAATASFQAAQSRTIVPSAYCANYNDGTRNCGFPTMQACRQAMSGVGGVCRRNPRAPS